MGIGLRQALERARRSAAARLKKLTDEIARHLAVDVGVDPQGSPDRSWDRPGGLELALVSFDSFRKEFVVRFKAGPRYRLPLRRLGDSGEVAASWLTASSIWTPTGTA